MIPSHYLLCLLLLCATGTAQASNLIPLESWNERNPGWQQSDLDFAYVLTRCGALSFSIGLFLQNNPSDASSFNLARSYVRRGSTISLKAIPLYRKNQVSMEFIDQRTKALMTAYYELMQEKFIFNNRLHNSLISSDVNFCRIVEPDSS